MRGTRFIIATIIVFLIISNFVIGILWRTNYLETREKYSSEISVLQNTLDNIGEIVTIYSVRSDVLSGTKLIEEQLQPIEVPLKSINDMYVKDINEAIGMICKINLAKDTMLTKDMLLKEEIEKSSRLIEVVVPALPTDIHVGDYVDYRITYPLGEDYIILPKKRVYEIRNRIVKVILNEQELHYYQASLIDYYLNRKNGANLYFTKYIEPSMQEDATRYYAIPKNIESIMLLDPNVIEKINSGKNEEIRSIIQNGIDRVGEQDSFELNSGRTEVNGMLNQERENYLNEEKEKEEKKKQEQEQQQQLQQQQEQQNEK